MADAPIEALDALRASALAALDAAGSAAELDAWRVEHLGRSGKLTQVLRGVVQLPVEERRTVGAAGNAAKALLEERLAGRRAALEAARMASLAADAVDVTLPGRPIAGGRHHPSKIGRASCRERV